MAIGGTTHPQNVFKTSQTNNAGEDYLQVQGVSGTVLARVDAQGNVITPSIVFADGSSISTSIGEGTVTSVSGTANQIASTGGTTPVLSLASAITLPGTLAVTGTNTISTADGAVGGGLALYPDNYSSSTDICARINAAVLALPATGGVVDDSARTGTVACNTNPWAGAVNNVTIKLGPATYQTTVGWVMSNRSKLIGFNPGDAGVNGTQIEAVAGFPSSTVVVDMGSISSTVSMQVRDLTVNCNNQTGAIGIRNLWSNTNTYVKNVVIGSCLAIGLDVETANTQSSYYENVFVLPGASASAGTLGIKVFNTQNVTMINMYPNSAVGHVTTNCMTFDQASGVIINPQFQYCTNGILLNNTTSNGDVSIINATGGVGTVNTITFGTNANANAGVSYHIINANGGSTSALTDNVFASNVLTNVAEYSINEISGGAGTFIICHASPPCNSSLAGTLTLGHATGTNGQIGLSGSTSGTATLAAPAVAGTLANPIVSSNGIKAPNFNTTNLLISSTAPTITGHFNTSGDSISANNGAAAFQVTVGTGTAGSTGTVGLPTATTGWSCSANNANRAAVIQQTGAVTTNSATFTNYGTTPGTPVNWSNSDVLRISCFGY